MVPDQCLAARRIGKTELKPQHRSIQVDIEARLISLGSVKEAVPFQLVARSARHALLAGQRFDCPGELQLDRPDEFGRLVAHGHSVTLLRHHKAADPRRRRPSCRGEREGTVLLQS
jgi:hypothetical protein